MTFTRRVENFKCRHCGAAVRGNGYTNHCPKCLWSRHVDIDPGDRLEICRGMMEPVGAEADARGYRVIHKCASCGAERRVKTTPEDDVDAVFLLIR